MVLFSFIVVALTFRGLKKRYGAPPGLEEKLDKISELLNEQEDVVLRDNTSMKRIQRKTLKKMIKDD
jgi:hypothetical protein